MTNRRQVIGAGLALSVLPRVGGSPSAHEASGPTPVAVGRLLVDARFEDAVAMARQAAMQGIPGTALARDVLGLWHDDLLPALNEGRLAAFGGATTETSLFLFRTLASDHRMRVVYHADHARVCRAVMRHVLAGSARTVARVAGSPVQGAWPLRFGQAFAACHATGRASSRTILTACDPLDRRDVTLVSWVIAPARLARG